MPFSEMSVHNRERVLAWVRGHPWGREAVMSADGVLYGCVPRSTATTHSTSRLETISFVSLHELAGWAGY